MGRDGENPWTVSPSERNRPETFLQDDGIERAGGILIGVRTRPLLYPETYGKLILGIDEVGVSVLDREGTRGGCTRVGGCPREGREERSGVSFARIDEGGGGFLHSLDLSGSEHDIGVRSSCDRSARHSHDRPADCRNGRLGLDREVARRSRGASQLRRLGPYLSGSEEERDPGGKIVLVGVRERGELEQGRSGDRSDGELASVTHMDDSQSSGRDRDAVSGVELAREGRGSAVYEDESGPCLDTRGDLAFAGIVRKSIERSIRHEV